MEPPAGNPPPVDNQATPPQTPVASTPTVVFVNKQDENPPPKESQGKRFWLMFIALFVSPFGGYLAMQASRAYVAASHDPRDVNWAGPLILVFFILPGILFVMSIVTGFVLYKLMRYSLVVGLLVAGVILVTGGTMQRIDTKQLSAMKEASDERRRVPFQLYLPEAAAPDYTKGDPIISRDDPGEKALYTTNPVYTVNFSPEKYEPGGDSSFEVVEFQQTHEFNPPTNCGNRNALISQKDVQYPCEKVGETDSGPIYLMTPQSKEQGSLPVLYGDFGLTVVTLEYYEGDDNKNHAAMLLMMESMVRAKDPDLPGSITPTPTKRLSFPNPIINLLLNLK